MATATTTAQPAIAQVQIESLRTERMLVPIIGTNPLIMHRFDEKAKRQILEATQGKRKLKEPKDPEADFERSIYRTVDGRYGFPTLGFKAATVSAARFWGKTQISMTMLRQCVFFTGEMSDSGEMLTVIEGEPTMREDYVRVGQGTDMRYRAQFMPWGAALDIVYFPAMLSRESVLALIDGGGLGVGVGDWRPEKSGQFGTYRVDLNRAIEFVEVV